jgi:hypothetical protein
MPFFGHPFFGQFTPFLTLFCISGHVRIRTFPGNFKISGDFNFSGKCNLPKGERSEQENPLLLFFIPMAFSIPQAISITVSGGFCGENRV